MPVCANKERHDSKGKIYSPRLSGLMGIILEKVTKDDIELVWKMS